MENKEVKAENTAKPADPDDIYAKLDWETNPPINGFYEMMMELTPERRKELRELARQHNEKHENRTVATITPEVPREQPAGGNTAGSSRRTCCYRYSTGNGGYFPFFPTSNRKSRRRKSRTLRRVPTIARRRCTCAKARWWLTGGVITSAI